MRCYDEKEFTRRGNRLVAKKDRLLKSVYEAMPTQFFIKPALGGEKQAYFRMSQTLTESTYHGSNSTIVVIENY